MERILTGIQSTGIPHLGNILGSILPAISLAQTSQTPALFFIADLHALTTNKNPKQLQHFTHATAATWLACGLNINKHLLYRQSCIPQVCELAWYLSSLTPYPMLANAHAFKDKSNQLANVSAGLFTYPILMAADILLYKATHIPVGKDQQQHLEIVRDITQNFHRTYQPLFPIPKAHIDQNVSIIPGIDGRKMSKSYNNTINIFADDKTLEKTIMSITTNSIPLKNPKNPQECIIFKIYQHIATEDQTNQMKKRYLAGGYGYQDAKKELLKTILTTFKQQRKTFTTYMQTPHLIEEQLIKSEKKAQEIANKTLEQIRASIGIKIF